MKILFYDGSLTEYFKKAKKCPAAFIVDAYYGPSANYAVLSTIYKNNFSDAVLTNSLVALSHVFG
mgnify:CR=1 FL=1